MTDSRPKRFLWFLIFLGISGGIALLLAEVAVRITGLADHLVTDPIFVASEAPHVRYHYKPGIEGQAQGNTPVATNALGFRDREYPSTPDSGVVRLVVLGDSFTFGQGVEFSEVFTEVLETRLGTLDPSVPVEVLNFGVQGYTVEDEVGVFLDIARHTEPEIAILAMISHDLNLERTMNFVDGRGYLTKSVGGFDRFKSYLRSSHLILLLKEIYLQRVFRRTETYARREVTAETLGSRLELLDRSLETFIEACGGSEVLPVFALLDTRAGPVTEAILEHVRTKYPHLEVVDCVSVLDPLPLEEVANPRDGHPTARAHGLIAGRLEEAVLPLLGWSGVPTDGN